MRTQIEPYPGGLAVVVPASLAVQAGLRAGASADVEWNGGELIVRSDQPVTLDDLLAGITPENLHSDLFAGPPRGSELL